VTPAARDQGLGRRSILKKRAEEKNTGDREVGRGEKTRQEWANVSEFHRTGCTRRGGKDGRRGSHLG